MKDILITKETSTLGEYFQKFKGETVTIDIKHFHECGKFCRDHIGKYGANLHWVPYNDNTITVYFTDAVPEDIIFEFKMRFI
jgi:hypothetical protein